MEASTVYYTDFRCPVGTSLTDKLRRLCIAAGIKNIDMEGKFVAIKMHFGELGNLAYLRPNYAKVVADLCKEQGGMPFLTDCNTLYPGSRKNALEHLTCAQLNGFWPMTTGCQVIIADGLRGTDEVEVPVPNGEYCKTAKIGRAIMDADIFISLSHFKGHESTGFGGAIKNIGMGCGSRAGKMEQHASGGAGRPLPRLSPLRQGVRLRRHQLQREEQGRHRPGQVQGLRPLHRCLQLRRHLCPVRQRQRDAGPQDGRVCRRRLP